MSTCLPYCSQNNVMQTIRDTGRWLEMYKRRCSLISCDFLCSLMYSKFSFIYYTQTMVESCFDSFCVYKCRQCCTTMYILGTKYTGCSQHPFGDMITKMTKILSLFCIVDNTLPHSSIAYWCPHCSIHLHAELWCWHGLQGCADWDYLDRARSWLKVAMYSTGYGLGLIAIEGHCVTPVLHMMRKLC